MLAIAVVLYVSYAYKFLEEYLRNLTLISPWEVHLRISPGERCGKEGMLFILYSEDLFEFL